MDLIEFERTPNPDALRIPCNQKLMAGPPRQFEHEAEAPPLARSLLAIEGIVRVMLATDFITVVRGGPNVPWETLRPAIAMALIETDGAQKTDMTWTPRSREPFGEIEEHIDHVLERYVRPLLAADGGEAILFRFDPATATASVRMEGACGGCPSGAVTLKRIIEQTIRHWVPEVRRVEAMGEPSSSTGDAKARFRQWIEAKWGSQARSAVTAAEPELASPEAEIAYSDELTRRTVR